MKDWKFNVVALAFISAIILGLYFILVNTVFADNVLINIDVEGKVYALIPETQARDLIASEAAKLLPAYLDVKVAGTEFTVPINDLQPEIDLSQLSNFGKGSDIGKIVNDSLAIVSGQVFNTDNIIFNFNPEILIEKIPYQQTSSNVAYIEGNLVKNCQNRSYAINYDSAKISAAINKAVLSDSALELKLEDIVTDPKQVEIINYCEKYNEFTGQLNNMIGEKIHWEDYLDYNPGSGSVTGLEFKNRDLSDIRTEFAKLATQLYLAPDSGSYALKGNTAYLYKKYSTGRELNISKTLTNLVSWLETPETTPEILSFNTLNPDIISSGYNIVDITYELGKGESRLDLVRDGRVNYRVHNSQIALDAIDLMILEPGQEFSFYYDSGIASGKIHGGIGVCNATTTLFRLALMSGFPITDRSPHTSYIGSYEYPAYPINNVEATFFGGPVVDLKFVNDLSYPVLLKTTIDRSKNDGYQYHTVTAYTSPDATKRVVELTDFKKWNITSEHKFQSSFTRKIWADASKTVLLKEDTFGANYY